jgi:hypothetical protein
MSKFNVGDVIVWNDEDAYNDPEMVRIVVEIQFDRSLYSLKHPVKNWTRFFSAWYVENWYIHVDIVNSPLFKVLNENNTISKKDIVKNTDE